LKFTAYLWHYQMIFRLVHMFELAALNFQLLKVVTPKEEFDKDGEVRIQIPKIELIIQIIFVEKIIETIINRSQHREFFPDSFVMPKNIFYICRII